MNAFGVVFFIPALYESGIAAESSDSTVFDLGRRPCGATPPIEAPPTEDIFVDVADLASHLVMAEHVGESLATELAKTISTIPVESEFEDRLSESRDVAGLNEDAGFAWQYDLSGTVDVVADDRSAGDERLRQDAGQAFAIAGVDDEVACIQ